MNKHELSERDICTKYILPALERAGWDRMLQLREEFEMSKGRITVRGKVVSRGRPRRADIVLCYKPNIPLAVIEAKSNLRSVGAGMQQALDYAETLKVPFAFSSNGDGFVFHDRSGQSEQTESGLTLDDYLRRKTEEVQAVERRLKTKAPLNHRQLALLGHALRHPGAEYSFGSHQRSHNIAYATARSDLLKLAELGLLDPSVPGQKPIRFFVPDNLTERIESGAADG